MLMKNLVAKKLGKVKKLDYLLFVLSVREEEYLAKHQGLKIKQRSTWELRQEYEREHGEIYENF